MPLSTFPVLRNFTAADMAAVGVCPDDGGSGGDLGGLWRIQNSGTDVPTDGYIRVIEHSVAVNAEDLAAISHSLLLDPAAWHDGDVLEVGGMTPPRLGSHYYKIDSVATGVPVRLSDPPTGIEITASGDAYTPPPSETMPQIGDVVRLVYYPGGMGL